jgi:hypothetical protein
VLAICIRLGNQSILNFMNIRSIVCEAREKSVATAFLARLLTRFQPLLDRESGQVSVDWGDLCVDFSGITKESAMQIAAALHKKLELNYEDMSWRLRGELEVGGLTLTFCVESVRKITFSACEVKFARRSRINRAATLFFGGYSLSQIKVAAAEPVLSRAARRDIKRRLWEVALKCDPEDEAYPYRSRRHFELCS